MQPINPYFSGVYGPARVTSRKITKTRKSGYWIISGQAGVRERFTLKIQNGNCNLSNIEAFPSLYRIINFDTATRGIFSFLDLPEYSVF